MRLIDADALIDAMTGACNIFDAHGVDTTLARTLITIADKAPTVGDWISVKDKLPEDARDVLIYAKGYNAAIGCYVASSGEWWRYGNHCKWYPVTHWMPLPEPPKEEEHEGH